jgi:hypothetical protein
MPPDTTGRARIYFLPPNLAPLQNDPVGHFHAELTALPEFGTMALLYGTSTPTDHDKGAPSLPVPKGTSPVLRVETHFCGAIIVQVDHAQLPPWRDTLTAFVSDLERVSYEGCGIGQGS